MFRDAIPIFVFGGLFVAFIGVSSGHVNPYSRLSSDLLDGYDKYALPVKNASEILAVEIGVCLHQIAEMDEKSQQFTVTAFIQQKWTDQYLEWDPSEYDGITETRLPVDMIWRPDTVVFNNVDQTYGHFTTSDSNAVITSRGDVLWLAPVLLKNSCKFDIKNVPYDTQKCQLPFASWSYEKTRLELVNASVRLDNYREHGKWELLEADIAPFSATLTSRRYEMAGALLTLTLQRRPQFCLLFVVVPYILIGAISLLVFLLPAESGEKMSLGITNLLTLILFYVEISHILPATADSQFPLLGTFHFVFICFVSASCILTVLVLNIYHRKNSQRPLPMWVRRLFFGRWGLHRFVWYFPGRREEDCYRDNFKRICRGPAWRPHAVKQSIALGNSLLSSPGGATPLLQCDISCERLSQGLVDIRSDISQTMCRLQRIESRLMMNENPNPFADNHASPLCSDWQKVSIILDQLFFIILFSLASVACIVFMILMSWS